MNMLQCTVHDPDLFSAEACGNEYYRKCLERHIYELLAHHIWPIPRDTSELGTFIVKAVESHPANARQRMQTTLEQVITERTVRVPTPLSPQEAQQWQSVSRGLAECMKLANIANPDCTILADANFAKLAGAVADCGKAGGRLADNVMPFAQYPDEPPETQVDLAQLQSNGFRDYVLRPAMRWSPVIWVHDRYISNSYVRHIQNDRGGRNWFKFRDTVHLILQTWLAVSREFPIAGEYSQIQQSLQKQGQEVPLPGVHLITDKPNLTGTQRESDVRAFAESLHSEIARGLDALSVHLVDERDCLKAVQMEFGGDGQYLDHRMRHPRFLKSSFYTLNFEPGLDIVRLDDSHIAPGTFVTLADEPARLVAEVMRRAAIKCRVRWPSTSSLAPEMPKEIGKPKENNSIIDLFDAKFGV